MATFSSCVLSVTAVRRLKISVGTKAIGQRWQMGNSAWMKFRFKNRRIA